MSDRDILSAQIGLLCNARNDFNDIDLYRDDEVFRHSFGIDRLPSEAAFRQRLDELPEQKTHAALRQSSLDFLRKREFGTVEARAAVRQNLSLVRGNTGPRFDLAKMREPAGFRSPGSLLEAFPPGPGMRTPTSGQHLGFLHHKMEVLFY